MLWCMRSREVNAVAYLVGVAECHFYETLLSLAGPEIQPQHRWRAASHRLPDLRLVSAPHI